MSIGTAPALVSLAALALSTAGRAAESYDLAFSTYLGGSGYDMARDVFVDAAGNVYVTGGTMSPDFPTTPGAYDRSFDGSNPSPPAFGHWDVFVCKFSPAGQPLPPFLACGVDPTQDDLTCDSFAPCE